MKKKSTYNDQYIVKVRYRKPDGYWTAEDWDIDVPILDYRQEKNLHDKARKIALAKFKALGITQYRIESVNYC